MPGSRVMKSQRGGGRGRSGGGSAPVAPPPDEPLRLPRGSRETAALLRAFGYALLYKEKLRRPQAQAQQGDGERAQQHAQPAAAGEQQQQQQQSRKVQRRQQEQQAEEEEEQQDQQLQRELRPRMVRIVEPPRSQHKRKHGSSSDDEEYRPSRSARGAPAAPQPPPPQPQVQQPGMKRVRSSWKMRPLLIGGWPGAAGRRSGSRAACVAGLQPLQWQGVRMQGGAIEDVVFTCRLLSEALPPFCLPACR